MSELSPEGEMVLDSDNGIISVALKMYANFVEKEGGCNLLWQRATDMHYEYKDKKNANE